jgi:hypothetical protein
MRSPMGWRHMVLSFSDLGPLGRPQGQITPSLMQPNAGRQPLPEAGAERTLEAVGWTLG